MKGAVKAIWAIFAIIFLAVFAYYVGVVVPATIRPAVTYDGEFSVVGLPTNGLEDPFYTDFSTVTNVAWTNGQQSTAGSATMSVPNTADFAPGTEHQLDLYIKIDGPVENLNLESTRLSTAYFNESYYKVVSAGLYDYDSGAKLFDIPVEDGEFDFDTGVLAKGEYVLRVTFRAIKTIDLGGVSSETTYTIMNISGELDTTGDNDEFSDFAVKITVTVPTA